MARTRHYETTTHWYTTCGAAYGRALPKAQKLERSSWHPLVGFFFTKEGHQDPAISEGITKFFQRYAECGLSEKVNVLLPRRDEQVSFDCAGGTCESNFTLYEEKELYVQWGEYVRLLPRVVDYGNLITDATPQEQRIFYGFTNVDCNAENSRLYPDFCRDTIPKNVTELPGKNIQLRLIWLTVKNNSEVCGNGEVRWVDFLKVYAYNSSIHFQNALSGTCNVATTSTNMDSPTRVPQEDGVSVPMIIGITASLIMLLLISVGALLYYRGWRFLPEERVEAHIIVLREQHNLLISDLTIAYNYLIGAGAFANVYRASYSIGNGGNLAKNVAAKIPRKRTEASIHNFRREIELMERLGDHDYLVNFIGYAYLQSGPVLVMEYCANGDLVTFLRKHLMSAKQVVSSLREPLLDERGFPLPISVEGLLRLCWQVSDGMVFLSDNGYVHRDLAARNVLLSDQMSAKIADFGLCRYTNMELYDAYQEVGLPTRWMAPEALRKAEFSSSSDVWSFGVLAYEMFSGGAIPYADVEPGRLLSFLESSGRLDQPGLCPVDVYDLMTDCWKASPDERPKFAQVREVFRMFLDKIGSGYANVM